jgi:hypothetical protein
MRQNAVPSNCCQPRSIPCTCQTVPNESKDIMLTNAVPKSQAKLQANDELHMVLHLQPLSRRRRRRLMMFMFLLIKTKKAKEGF